MEIDFEAGNIALDLDVEIDDLLPAGAENKNIRLADLLAEQVDAPRGAGDGIGHGRIGDENIMRILRQIDDNSLVQPKLQPTMGIAAGLRDADQVFGIGTRLA